MKHESPHYYRPLVTLTYMLDARSPLSPVPYHATNVLLHVLGSVLFLALLLRLGLRRDVSTVAASLFAVHPVVAGAVAYIPGRNDLLLACFVFGAWLCLERWRERRSPVVLAAHAVLLLGALLTKETAVVAPAVWMLSSFLDEKRRAPRRDGWLVAAWAAAYAVWLALRSSAPDLPQPLGSRLSAAWGHLPALLITSASS